MKSTEYAGIDYGLGQSNINHDTGIRFGVIHQNAVGQAWFDESEPFYGMLECPECGNAMQMEGGCSVCHSCGYSHCG